jgi:hypothetical protein
MEIISKTVKIKASMPINNSLIEQKLQELGIEPLRWAIVAIDKHGLTISLACESL